MARTAQRSILFLFNHLSAARSELTLTRFENVSWIFVANKYDLFDLILIPNSARPSPQVRQELIYVDKF